MSPVQNRMFVCLIVLGVSFYAWLTRNGGIESCGYSYGYDTSVMPHSLLALGRSMLWQLLVWGIYIQYGANNPHTLCTMLQCREEVKISYVSRISNVFCIYVTVTSFQTSLRQRQCEDTTVKVRLSYNNDPLGKDPSTTGRCWDLSSVPQYRTPFVILEKQNVSIYTKHLQLEHLFSFGSASRILKLFLKYLCSKLIFPNSPPQMVSTPTLTLKPTGHLMPQVGLGLWKLTENTADVVYDAIKIGYRNLDGACGMLPHRHKGRSLM